MYPWLFLLAPQYHLDFSPKMKIDSSHEKLWDVVIQIAKDAEHAKNNSEETRLGLVVGLQKVYTALQSSSEEKDSPHLLELKMHIDNLSK